MKRPSPSAASSRWYHEHICWCSITPATLACEGSEASAFTAKSAICQREQRGKVPCLLNQFVPSIHSFTWSISSSGLIRGYPWILRKLQFLHNQSLRFLSANARPCKNEMSERLLHQYNYTTICVTKASHVQVPHKMANAGWRERKTGEFHHCLCSLVTSRGATHLSSHPSFSRTPPRPCLDNKSQRMPLSFHCLCFSQPPLACHYITHPHTSIHTVHTRKHTKAPHAHTCISSWGWITFWLIVPLRARTW